MIECRRYGNFHALGNFSLTGCQPCDNFSLCKEMWTTGSGLITLQKAPCTVNRRRTRKLEFSIACHDPIGHWLGSPCIHIEAWRKVFPRTTIKRVIQVLSIELMHHVLLDLDEDWDKAWENFHGYYDHATKLLQP